LENKAYKMPKKIILVLGLFLIACGNVFADDADEEPVMPKNTITVDVWPTFFSLLVSAILNSDNPDPPMYFVIGTAVQYERQITEKASVAGRFEYGMLDTPGSEPKYRMSSISAEGHGRYYPGQGVFFLGGMLGYVYVFTDFSSEDREIKPSAHFLKYGAKLGWRIDFNKPGGFVLEPGVGFYGSIGTLLKTGAEEDLPILGTWLNILNSSIAKMLFIDGLRLSLSLGYRY